MSANYELAKKVVALWDEHYLRGWAAIRLKRELDKSENLRDEWIQYFKKVREEEE